jgi:hypothetical protein
MCKSRDSGLYQCTREKSDSYLCIFKAFLEELRFGAIPIGKIYKHSKIDQGK